jgi:hypothetical protein
VKKQKEKQMRPPSPSLSGELFLPTRGCNDQPRLSIINPIRKPEPGTLDLDLIQYRCGKTSLFHIRILRNQLDAFLISQSRPRIQAREFLELHVSITAVSAK